MFLKPGIRTKEGLKVSGLYGLVGSLILTVIFPDLSTEQVFESATEIADWYQSSGKVSIGEWVDNATKLGAVSYILAKLRKE
jgi:hypothetical protein